MINGSTTVYAILGTPLFRVRAPALYNCFFDRVGADAAFVPLTIGQDYSSFVRQLFKVENVAGAIVTLPHKRTIEVLDQLSPTARVAQACNVIVKRADGRLYGDIVDGIGFALGLKRAGFEFGNARCLLVGSGGAGAAIAAAVVPEGISYLGVSSRNAESAAGLVGRLRDFASRPDVRIEVASNDPGGYDLVINATPLGMNATDPLPIDVARLTPGTMVADIVMGDVTPLLRAAAARGCKTQPGTQMLIAQAPAVLKLWGFGEVTPEEIRQLTDALGWTP